MSKRMTSEEIVNIPVVLSKKLDGVIYGLMVRTITDNVFEGENSLTEVLADIRTAIDAKTSDEEFQKVQMKLNAFFNDDSDEVATLRDIHYYVHNCSDKIAAMEKILSKTVSMEQFNELTKKVDTLTDNTMELSKKVETFDKSLVEVKETLNNAVTQKELEEKLNTVETQLRTEIQGWLLVSDGSECPEEVPDGGIWIQTIPDEETTETE